jgi:hypothetical protein
MAENYMQPSGVGCAYGLIGLGSLVAGIYHGMQDAKGISMDNGLHNMLTYAPTVAGAIIGPYMADQMADHPMMREQERQVPPEARGCFRKVTGTFTGAIGMSIANGVGYAIGRYILS